ncbi:MAG: S-layer homology domain-containing protein, partial [bacterium]
GWQRNVLQLISYSSFEGEMIVASAETRVLRYKPFADVLSSHWALRPIVMSETLELVNGYPDNIFKPEKGISRAELVTLLVRTMPVNMNDLFIFAEFTDVPETHWANKYIAYGVSSGLVTGYPDGTFKPNKTLTRAEGITIFARYANLSSEAEATNALPFVDLAENFWANKYIIAADKAGLLKYLENKQFEPTKNFTRAEACAVLIETPQVEQKIDHYWETGETKIISSEVR